jgi:hypothetical protein
MMPAGLSLSSAVKSPQSHRTPKMMNDPSQQFQLYLEALPQSLKTMSAEKTPLEFAKAGYMLYCHPENWTSNHIEFIQHQITNDLNNDSLV